MKRVKVFKGSILKPLLAAFGLLISGCVNPYSQNYLSRLEKWPAPVTNTILLPQGPATLVSSTDMKTDAHNLLENGYILLGRSKFKDQLLDESQALEAAKTIGAWLVLVNHKYDQTITVQVPQITTSPDQTVTDTKTFVNRHGEEKTITETQTIAGTTSIDFAPENVDYYDYAATYWARTKPSLFGVLVKGPSTNPLKPSPNLTGLLVKIVIGRSPADYAGIQEGDILISLAGEQLSTPDQLFDVVSRNAGQEVPVEFTRNGQPLQVKVQLSKAE